MMNLCEEERVTLQGYLTLGRYVGSVLSISETGLAEMIIWTNHTPNI